MLWIFLQKKRIYGVFLSYYYVLIYLLSIS